MRVLVVNAGSSSLKLAVLDHDDSVLAARDLPAPRARIDRDAVGGALAQMPDADAVGHRIVHGGERFSGPVRIDAGVEAQLRELVDLAPLHQPKSLAALDVVSSLRPGLPAVAAFDTAFHRTLSAAASTYALPEHWRERFDLRRYGFHGLSHAYAARRAVELTGKSRQELRVITCHLGAGGSLAAVRDGKSVDTTMGFTPLEGLVMATRSGSIDPGLLMWLITDRNVRAHEFADALEHGSGLLGLAGTADMRELEDRDDPAARLAINVYIHSLRAGIAAMAAALGGLDAIVFTGGVGENSPKIRSLAADGLAFLGIALDPARNENGHSDRDISTDGAPVSTLVVAAREDLEIARQVRQVLEEGVAALAGALVAGCGGSAAHTSSATVTATVSRTVATPSTAPTPTPTVATVARPHRHHSACPQRAGALPQTARLPSAATPCFHELMRSLWRGISTGSTAAALPAFFPEAAYAQVKAVADPGADWLSRLVGEFRQDLTAANALTGTSSQLVKVEVPATYAHWVDPGACYNRIGYYEVPNSRVVYSKDGEIRSLGIASMISWRGVWYVVHLGAVVRPADVGVVDDPSAGAGLAAPSSTC